MIFVMLPKHWELPVHADRSVLRLLVLPLLLALLASCSQQGVLQQFASPEEQAFARSYIERLRQRDFDSIQRAADASIAGAGMREALEKMAAVIPPGEPTSVKLVGAHRVTQGNVTSLDTTFEYEYPGAWLVANVAVQDRNGAKSIIGLYVYPRTQSLESESRFTLVGKTAVQYAVLVGSIGAVGVSLYALFVCARTKPLRKKWLWILFILAGVGKFAVNWTSGEWFLSPLTLQLLSASAVAPLYGPWVLSFSIPVGAIVFLARARRARHLPVDS